MIFGRDRKLLLSCESMYRRLNSAVIGPLLILASPIPSAVAAQTHDEMAGDAVPTARAAVTDEAPVIDGRLDEAVWSSATVLENFLQHEPLEGQQPTERTEIRILCDRAAIYIGGWMFDRDPSGILLGENRRDANLQDADALLIVLDTFHDRQNAYVFGTTPVGIEYDGQVTKDGQGGLTTARRMQSGAGSVGGFNLNWDGSWEIATSIDEDGWYAEFRIPFSTLRYAGGGAQTWGLNISRTVRRRNEEAFWAPIPRQYTLYRISQAGILEGIESPTRRSARVTPYVLSSAHRDYDAATDVDWNGEVGGDAKIGLTSGLNLDLTYNTDFAQVEIDEQQINLTRFSIFLPEKRPFFLENAGMFSVGTPGAGSDLGLDLFYSRRIGIGLEGQPVPIVGGGRLNGKAGSITIGLLDIQTEAVGAEGIPSNNYSVGRVIQELPNRSQIGALVTGRLNTDSTADYNLTYAVDGRVGIGQSINLDAYVGRTETPGRNGRQYALGFNGGYQTRDWDVGLQYREVGEDFNPEVGFLPRSAYRLFVGRLQRNIRVPAVSWIRELRPHAMWREFFDFEGFNETRYVHVDNAIDFENGAFLSTAVNVHREGLKEPFEIADSVILPAETYDFVESTVRYGTNPSAVWSLDGEATIGGFYSGTRKGMAWTLTNRIGSTWSGSLRFSYDAVEVDEGSFETVLVGLKAAYSFTPRVFLQSLIQYDNQSDDFSVNFRFGWLNTAGTGLYLVYNEVQQTVSPTGPEDRVFVVKYTRQFNLIQ